MKEWWMSPEDAQDRTFSEDFVRSNAQTAANRGGVPYVVLQSTSTGKFHYMEQSAWEEYPAESGVRTNNQVVEPLVVPGS